MAFDFEDDNYENIFSEATTVNKYTRQGFEFSSDHKTLLVAPKDIIEFEVPKYVVSIGPSAFKRCKMLERIILHDTIRSIAKDAFEYCSALKTFELSGSIDCINLSFRNCTSLSSIRIPDSIKIIGALDLRKCKSLKEIRLPKSLETLDLYLKDECLDLSNTLITSLPDNLNVEGSLCLNHTPITSLPDNLKVGGGLYLSHTLITSLPENMKVK